MDRDDARARAAQRQRVLRVDERGAEAPQQRAAASTPSAAPGARAQLERLDAVGHELGVARDGGEPEARLGRRAPELAQQVRARTVSSPVRSRPSTSASTTTSAHASSRQSSTRSPPTRSQVNSAARVRARARPARRAARPASAMPSAIDAGVARVDEHRGATRDLLGRAATRRHDGRPARHRLEHREPEALVQRRVDEAARAAVERRELLVAGLADPAGNRRRHPSPGRRPRGARRRRARAASTARARFFRGSSVATAST